MRKLLVALALIFCLSLGAQNRDNWTQVGMVVFPENPSVQTTGMGRVSDLVYHPTDSTILFAVSASGGLWKSSNEGKSWSSMNDYFPRTQCASVCINPLNPDIIYLGTGDANYNNANGLGIWKSLDGGQTWSQQSSGLGNRLVSRIWINPNDTAMLIIAAGDGIYKTINSAQSWVKRSSVAGSYRDLKQKANSQSTVFFAATNTELYRSFDRGDSWTALSHPGTPSGLKVGVSEADSSVFYTVSWSGGNNKFNGLYRSNNDGNSFSLQSDTPNILGYSSNGSSQDGQGAYNLDITIDPNDINTLYIAAINAWKSTNAGQSWILKSHWAYGVHADKHRWLFSPYNPNKLYITHDGGMDRTEDGGDTWTTLSDGLSASEFYKMGQSILRKDVLIGGLQDNGLNIFEEGIFRTIRGGDWTGDFHFDYVDSNLFYFNGGRKRKVSGGEEDINGEGNYILHPLDSNVMFYGTDQLYRTDNLRANPSSQVTWTQRSSLSGTAIIRDLSITEKAPNNVYFARNDGSLWRCESCLGSNPNFVQLTSKPSGTITQVYAHPRDSNCIYISIGAKLYRSSNRGQTWIDYAQNLPNLAITKFIIDGSTNDTVTYVANALGVYFRRATQSSWTNFSGSLPTIAPISDMEIYLDPIHPSDSRLRISTYGRGIWQTDLYRTSNLAPIADFQVNKTSGNCDGLYLLNDISTQSPAIRKWSISPASGWSYINGSDSLSRVMEVQFQQAGTYLITLEVRNAYGSSVKIHELRYSTLDNAASCGTSTSMLGGYTIGIYRFEFNTIDNSSAYTLYQTSNGEDFTCTQSTMVQKGGTYTASITNGNSYSENAKIYIDYNNNGQFENSELAGSIAAGKGRRSTQITIDSVGAISGTFIRLRVVSDFNNVTGPCGNLSYGQHEDYALYIDTIVPKLSISLPKPKVHRQFTATLTWNKWMPDFDESMIQVSNAKLLNFRHTSAFVYEAEFRPILNGAVGITLPANTISDEAGNSNAWLSVSTEFELALQSFSIPGLSSKDSLVKLPNGGKIYVEVPYGTDLTRLIPSFTTIDTATLLRANKTFRSGVDTIDATDSLEFVLRSKDGLIAHSWWLFVKSLPNTACDIKTFSLQSPNVMGTIIPQGSGGVIDLTVPYPTNISVLIAQFVLADSAKARVNSQWQISGSSVQDFSIPLVYEVLAQDGISKCSYTVNVQRAANTGAELFSFGVVKPVASGIITPNSKGGEVKVLVPYGTSRDSLVTQFSTSDSASVYVNGMLQLSGLSWNDFTDSLWYDVFSQSGLEKRRYLVRVEILPNTACDLLSFSMQSPNVQGIITADTSGGTVVLVLPFGNDMKGLTPFFTVSDQAEVLVNGIVQTSGLSTQDFDTPLWYEVISASGNESKSYSVEVRIQDNDSCDLKSYGFAKEGITGTIIQVDTGGFVSLDVQSGQLADIKTTIAIFQLSDSAKAYMNGVPQWSGITPNDFEKVLNYQIISQDSTCKKSYQIKVNLLQGIEVMQQGQIKYWPNPSKDIVHLSWTNDTYLPVKFHVFNAAGQLIHQQDSSHSQHLQLDLSTYPPGTYLVQYRRGKESGMLRIVRE